MRLPAPRVLVPTIVIFLEASSLPVHCSLLDPKSGRRPNKPRNCRKSSPVEDKARQVTSLFVPRKLGNSLTCHTTKRLKNKEQSEAGWKKNVKYDQIGRMVMRTC